MKNTFILLIGFVALSISTAAQDNYGYYGKKNFVDASFSSYVPLIYNIFPDPGYKVASYNPKALEPKKRWLQTGGRVSIGRAFKTNFGAALEVGYDRVMLTRSELKWIGFVSDEWGGLEKFIVNHENLIVNSILILPRIEIGARNGLLPNGLVHQIGVGFTVNSIAKKNYLVIYNQGTSSGGPKGEAKDQEELFENLALNGSIKLIQLMYGLKMRMPVGKSMMINYGFRYTIDFGFLGSSKSKLNSSVAKGIQEHQLSNVIAFDLGLTLPF